MIWKLLLVAEKSFRALKGYWPLENVSTRQEYIAGAAVRASKVTERVAA